MVWAVEKGHPTLAKLSARWSDSQWPLLIANRSFLSSGSSFHTRFRLWKMLFQRFQHVLCFGILCTEYLRPQFVRSASLCDCQKFPLSLYRSDIVIGVWNVGTVESNPELFIVTVNAGCIDNILQILLTIRHHNIHHIYSAFIDCTAKLVKFFWLRKIQLINIVFNFRHLLEKSL